MSYNPDDYERAFDRICTSGEALVYEFMYWNKVPGKYEAAVQILDEMLNEAYSGVSDDGGLWMPKNREIADRMFNYINGLVNRFAEANACQIAEDGPND